MLAARDGAHGAGGAGVAGFMGAGADDREPAGVQLPGRTLRGLQLTSRTDAKPIGSLNIGSAAAPLCVAAAMFP